MSDSRNVHSFIGWILNESRIGLQKRKKKHSHIRNPNRER